MTISEEIEHVLILLSNQTPPHHNGGLTLRRLSSQVDVPRLRLFKLIKLLERAGYLRLQRSQRTTLITLTPAGRQRAAQLRKPAAEPAPPHQGHRLFTLASALGIVGVIAFLWWWLGLYPQSDAPRLAGVAAVSDVELVAEPVPTSLASATVEFTQAAAPPLTVTGTPLPSPTATLSPTQEAPAPTTPGPGMLPSAIPIATPDPNGASWGIPTPVPLAEQPQDAVNILLMGSDTSQGSWRTDSLIIVSVHPGLPSVSMLSIPRDLFVYIPGWQMGRINTADYHGEQVGYPGGGPGLVKSTIEYNLGVRVHYYARVNFDGFVEILETLGGVDVVVDCELHDTFPDPQAPAGRTDIDLLPGLHHLDGKQALWYARSRWNTSDFDRGRRQQRVLRGVFAQIKSLGLLSQVPELWDQLTQTLQTDIPVDTALWLASVAGRLDTGTALKSRFIDDTVVRHWRTSGGAAVLLPIYEGIAPLVAEALAPPDTARARQGVARIQVLNGTTWPDWGALAADRLLWEGFEVVGVAPAERTDYQQTTIVDLTQSAKGSPLELLSQVLRVREENILPPDSQVTDVGGDVDFQVVVGHDYVPCYRSYWRAVHGSAP
jgi:LCP family protein required for cell wall assembly